MNRYKSTYRNAQPSSRFSPAERLTHEWVPMLEGWKICKHCEGRWWEEEIEPIFKNYWLYKYLTPFYTQDRFYNKDGVEYDLPPRCKMAPKATPRKGFRT